MRPVLSLSHAKGYFSDTLEPSKTQYPKPDKTLHSNVNYSMPEHDKT